MKIGPVRRGFIISMEKIKSSYRLKINEEIKNTQLEGEYKNLYLLVFR
ncbi:protein of unknown function [Shewanella benthica]|uniref:Uncharacterized protein n=1 Tax=Shewanella benthica TaxID=43661 RepID=A0A330LYD5_9GAMM|nr:protein of unknown function [Shewanella benthica]